MIGKNNNLDIFDKNKTENPTKIIKGIKSLKGRVINNVKEEDIIPKNKDISTLTKSLVNIGGKLDNLKDNPEAFINEYIKGKEKLMEIYRLSNKDADNLLEAIVNRIEKEKNVKSA